MKQSWFFKKTNNEEKPLPKLFKMWSDNIQINKIINKSEDKTATLGKFR